MRNIFISNARETANTQKGGFNVHAGIQNDNTIIDLILNDF